MSNKVVLTKRTNPNIKLEVSEDELFTLANGGRINNDKTWINGGRDALISNWLIDGEPVTPERLKQNSVDTRESSWVDKITGHIPTLTDVGNLLATGAGKALGWVDNPFTEQIAKVKRALQVVKPGSPEEQRLQAALKTLEMSSNDWSSYDVVAKNDDVSAAPALLQGIHHAAKTVGDNVDLFDVGTAFVPVGIAGKAAKLGSKIPKVGKPMAKVAGAAAKHPGIAETVEQTGLEGLHGALTYKPEEDEYMLSNAAQQGAIAGGLQGIVSGIGGRRLKAIKNLPENVKINEALEALKTKGVNVPEFNPTGRAGEAALTPEELKNLQYKNWVDRELLLGKNVGDVRVGDDEVKKAIDRAQATVKGKPTTTPTSQYMQFEGSPSEYEKGLRGILPRASEDVDMIYARKYPGRDLKDVVRSMPQRGGLEGEADQEFIEELLKIAGVDKDPAAVAANYEMYKKIKDANVAAQLRKNLQVENDLKGLAGLEYASKPGEKVAEKPGQKIISQLPIVNRLPDIYEYQKLPAWSRGDLSAAWERAKRNILLDEAREGLEGLTGWMAED